MRAAVAAGLLLLATGPALGEALTKSPAPRAKPAQVAVAGAPPAAMARPRPRPAGLVTFVVGGPAFASGLPAMRPRLRPASADLPAATGTANASLALSSSAGRAPQPRPLETGGAEAVVPVAYRAQPPAAIVRGLKGSVCGNPQIRGRTIPPILSRVRGCGLQDGVEITSVAGVQLGDGVQVDCTTAVALASWVHDRLKPTVGNLGGGVVALETGPTYACRPRNNQKGNRVSEHGRGAALDIMGIRLASGAVLSVRDGWGTAKQGQVLKAIHASACGPFTTVLGPKSDRFHKDHFHFDTASGRGPYCR